MSLINTCGATSDDRAATEDGACCARLDSLDSAMGMLDEEEELQYPLETCLRLAGGFSRYQITVCLLLAFGYTQCG